MAMKMAAAGYKTHMFGKWGERHRSVQPMLLLLLNAHSLVDVGMATPDHTPHGRGYMTALHYFHHANDYWTYTDGGGCASTNPDAAGWRDVATYGEPAKTSAKCEAAMKGPCGAMAGKAMTCVGCLEKHQQAVVAAGCSQQDVEGFCHYGPQKGGHSFVDQWQTNIDAPGTQGPAHGYNNTCPPGGKEIGGPGGNRLGQQCTVHGPKTDHVYGGYEDALYAQQVLRTVAEHDVSQRYFLFWAPHIVHAPLQVPPEFYHKFDFDAETDKAGNERQTYHAMVNFADTAIGNYTEAIKAKGMWDEMVIVFSADNGGPVYNNGSAGANNCAPKPTPCSILLLAQACAKESTTGCG